MFYSFCASSDLLAWASLCISAFNKWLDRQDKGCTVASGKKLPPKTVQKSSLTLESHHKRITIPGSFGFKGKPN